jgi:hypothetical protein
MVVSRASKNVRRARRVHGLVPAGRAPVEISDLKEVLRRAHPREERAAHDPIDNVSETEAESGRTAMNGTRLVAGSASYVISVPDQVHERREEGVSSFWVDRDDLLLQLSSYIRTQGDQLTASARLNDRIRKDPHGWTAFDGRLHPDLSIDQATAQFVDDNGLFWIYTYLVWPHLTILATVSGSSAEITRLDNWAMRAVTSIKLSIH